MPLSLSWPADRIEEYCHRWKIVELSLFGSALREDFRPDSDVDLLTRERDTEHAPFFHHARGTPFGFPASPSPRSGGHLCVRRPVRALPLTPAGWHIPTLGSSAIFSEKRARSEGAERATWSALPNAP